MKNLDDKEEEEHVPKEIPKPEELYAITQNNVINHTDNQFQV